MNNFIAKKGKEIFFSFPFIAMLVSFFCAFSSLFAQDSKMSGKVVNQKKEPIEYASIVFFNKNQGVYSDKEGHFKLNYANSSDSIAVFALGYKPYKTVIHQVLKDTIIVLIEEEYSLNEVKVTNAKSKFIVKDIGYHQSIYRAGGGYKLASGSQVAVKLEHPKPQTTCSVEKIKFSVKKVGKCHYYLRVRLLSVNDKGAPGADLITENLIIDVEQYRRKISIDVSQYNIKFPEEGIFTVIEWLEPSDDCDNKKVDRLSEDNHNVSPFIWGNRDLKTIKTWSNYRDRNWIKFPEWDFKEYQSNASVGLTVKILKN